MTISSKNYNRFSLVNIPVTAHTASGYCSNQAGQGGGKRKTEFKKIKLQELK